MIIGIDIGTSYSSVACLKNGRAEKIKPGTESDYSVPSAVYVKEDGTILIGRAAAVFRMKDPSRYKENFKRDFGAEVPYLLGGKSVTAYDIYLEYLRYFKESAEAFAGEAVEKAYITHPVSYSAEKKLLLKKAATYAGMTSVELLDEPTAAALSFFTEHNPRNGEKLLIYDLGGGTLDLTLAEVRDGGLRLLSDSVGDTRLGGADFDHLLYDELVAAFSKENDLSAVLSNGKFIGTLIEESVKAKHNLSRDTTAYVNIALGLGEYLEHTLTRGRFEELIAPLIERSCELARKIVENAGLAANQLDRVLLVGGSTRIPYVAKRLEEAMGKRVITSGDPELAVCMGAVLREVVGVKATAEKTSAPARPAASVVQKPAPTSKSAQKWETNLDTIVDNAMKRLNSTEHQMLFKIENATMKYGTQSKSVTGVVQKGMLFPHDSLYLCDSGGNRLCVAVVDEIYSQNNIGLGTAIQGSAVRLSLSGLQGVVIQNGYTLIKPEGTQPTQFQTAERERVEREKAEREKAERQKADREKAERQKADRERAERQKAERERAERQKAERERAERQRAERERAERQKAERERPALEAQEWYEKGRAYYKPGTYAEAEKYFRKAAGQGNADAFYYLGIMYEFGDSVNQNRTEAFRLFLKAAELGQVSAQLKVASIYFQYPTVTNPYKDIAPMDVDKAVYWYRKAAEQGSEIGQLTLGNHFAEEGRAWSNPKHYEEASIWLHRAIAQGSERVKEEAREYLAKLPAEYQ